MTLSIEDLSGAHNPLAPDYSSFRVEERVLLTGHSHQAWPDRAQLGLLRAWRDAAELADGKWEKAAERAERVRDGYRRVLGDAQGRFTLGASTHNLMVRFLSALPWRERRRVVTTDGEFHAMRRQFARLEEEGIQVVRVPSSPAADVGERLAAATDDRTLLVFVSTVFFESARIAGGLESAARACRRHGAALVLDTYHQLNAVPFDLEALGLTDAYAVGGGYKYMQLGEGNAFLRFPADCRLRPVWTGWFAEFDLLTRERQGGAVPFGDGHQRFAGATYDPTSHYRAAEVLDYFADKGLAPERLRQISQHQIGRLIERFDAADLDPSRIDRDRTARLDEIGGFLALRSPQAAELHTSLLERGVFTDVRGTVLRLGPAPYLGDHQLDEAMDHLAESVRHLS